MNDSILIEGAGPIQRKLLWASALAGCFVAAQVAHAQVIIPKFQMQVTTTTKLNNGDVKTYDGLVGVNEAVYIPEFGSSEEFGAQLTLNTGGGATPVNVFKGISFSYFANYSQPNGLTYRIYANDGALIGSRFQPGTFLFEFTDSIQGSPSGSIVKQNVNIGFNSTLVVPTDITVTVQFAGLSETHLAGLMTTDANPTAGSQASEIWYTTDAGASWVSTSLIPVPEPNSVLIVGGLLGLVAATRAARKLQK